MIPIPKGLELLLQCGLMVLLHIILINNYYGITDHNLYNQS